MRRAGQTVRTVSVQHLYGKTGGKLLGGILMCVFGGLFTLASSVVTIVMLATELWLGAKISGGLLIPSAILLGGGIAYTVGAILYGIGSKKRWFHSVFHIFVVLGSLLQFLAVLLFAL